MRGTIISQRGCANPRRGGPTYCWPKLVENYMKMKKNWMKGGLHPKHPNPTPQKNCRSAIDHCPLAQDNLIILVLLQSIILIQVGVKTRSSVLSSILKLSGLNFR